MFIQLFILIECQGNKDDEDTEDDDELDGLGEPECLPEGMMKRNKSILILLMHRHSLSLPANR